VNIGKSVVIKGELNGSEDLTIEGQVEGKIELRQNVLTIGSNARIKAQVFAKAVIILGEVTGNVSASEKVDIRDNGSVDGDIAAPARRDCRRRAFPGQHRYAEGWRVAEGRDQGARCDCHRAVVRTANAGCRRGQPLAVASVAGRSSDPS
jgi:cytoskeletal protein CcmA (bactofilin family)